MLKTVAVGFAIRKMDECDITRYCDNGGETHPFDVANVCCEFAVAEIASTSWMGVSWKCAKHLGEFIMNHAPIAFDKEMQFEVCVHVIK